jgi:uncharacterized protein (DUF362 family)
VDSVALVKYKQDIGRALEEGLELLGGFRALKSPVIVKPNICTISDNTGFSVTNVAVVEALFELLLKENDRLAIRIVESDSQSKFAEEAFEKFGYKQLENDMRSAGFAVSLVNLSQSQFVPVTFDGAYFKNPNLPDAVVGSGYFISVAGAKTHYLTFLTGILKNQFGLLPRKDQGFYHPHINEVIVDLNRLVRPDFCVVDARVGIEGWNGPKSRLLEAFILGYQPVSVDATMARVMGFEPGRIRHLVESSRYDLGTLNPTVLGQSVDALEVKFSPPA